MDLLLWRHAEAEELKADGVDWDRVLTARGEKQAKRMSQWLDRHMPDTSRVLCSPAKRTEQTALALGRKYKLCDELAPSDSGSQALLNLVNWPTAKGTVLVIGHQPTLGQTISRLVGLQSSECAVKKGSVWWLKSRIRDGVWQTVVVSVQSPETI
jgi:phosphohistidine phosphatase